MRTGEGNGRSGALPRAAAVLALLAIVAGLFAWSLKVREPYRNRALSTHFETETACTACYVENWLDVGILKMRLMLQRRPDSIDYPILDNLKDSYVSYPPGTAIPVYLIAKISGARNIIKICTIYNLANQFAISVFLLLITWHFVTRFGRFDVWSSALSLAPPFLYLFTLPPFYFHQHVYFGDEAVLLPLVIFVYLETRYFSQGRFGAPETVCAWISIFWMTFTNWLSLFALLTGAALRVSSAAEPDRRRASRDILLHYAPPASAALGIFLWQVFCVGDVHQLVYSYTKRLRMHHDGTVTNFWRQYFVGFFMQAYGRMYFAAGAIAIPATVCWDSIERRLTAARGKTALGAASYIAILTALPCLLMALLFQQHHIVHDFTVLKWSLPFSLVPFALFPLIAMWRLRGRRWYHGISLVIVAIVIAALFRVWGHTSSQMKPYFGEEAKWHKNVGEIVRFNASRNDICFAFDFDIADNYTTNRIKLAYARKFVYRVRGFDAVGRWLDRNHISGDAGVRVFVNRKDWPAYEAEARRRSVRVYPYRNYYVCVVREPRTGARAMR